MTARDFLRGLAGLVLGALLLVAVYQLRLRRRGAQSSSRLSVPSSRRRRATRPGFRRSGRLREAARSMFTGQSQALLACGWPGMLSPCL